MSNDSADAVGLTLGFIVFFLDLIVFCIFISRVRVSFNKQIIDEDWQSANDYWLKLSRLSGLMFSIFHIGTMSIIIAECTHIDKSILHRNGIAHIYWLLESLWLFNVNSAIVLITMRCYRVYKTTKTKFTPLRDWMSSNTKSIEYLIWIIYILIALFIIIQYIIIISSAPNQYFDIELSIINASRNFGTAAILSFQLIIACFFFYIAHKSQQQTNWNEQSKAIILKETAKLAFIVIFLAIIIGIILYVAIWYLLNINNKIALNAPFNDTKHRVFWSILEFLAFWLILYLTRLRKPSDNDPSIGSSTNTFLRRAFSVTKDKKKALRAMKQKELEERKKAFKERERKRYHNIHKHKPMRTADNTFNTILIKRVAQHEREKKLKLTLILDIKQRKMKSIHKELKEHVQHNQTDPDLNVIALNVLKEDDADEPNALLDDDSPFLEPIPHDIDALKLPKIAMPSMPMLLTSPSLPYALTPTDEQKNNHVAVVLTPHRDKLSLLPSSWNISASQETDTDDDDDMFLTEDEEDDAWNTLPKIEEKKSESNVTGFKSIMAKIGSAFTPRYTNDDKQTDNERHKHMKFPDIDASEAKKAKSRAHRSNTNTMNDTKPKMMMFSVNDEKQQQQQQQHIQDIVGIYLDAFKEKNESKQSETKTPQPIHTNTKRISDITQVFGDGMFHNMVHLKPMMLKRSHSDPDLRTRDKIWDQLLSAFIDINENVPSDNMTREVTPDYYFGSRHSSLASTYRDNTYRDDGYERESSNQTQLSETDKDRGFKHLFGWFNSTLEVNTPTLQEEEEEQKADGMRIDKRQRKKINKKKKKKKKTEARDSLQLPDSPVPDSIGKKTSAKQPLSVKITKKTNGKSTPIQPGKETPSHKRSSLMTVDIMKVTKFEPHGKQDIDAPTTTKLKSQRKKKLKKHRMRIKQKQQTKQWMDNVHQVF